MIVVIIMIKKMKKCMEYEVEGPRPRERQRGPGERLYERTVKHVK